MFDGVSSAVRVSRDPVLVLHVLTQTPHIHRHQLLTARLSRRSPGIHINNTVTAGLSPVHTSNNVKATFECCFDIVAGVDGAVECTL